MVALTPHVERRLVSQADGSTILVSGPVRPDADLELEMLQAASLGSPFEHFAKRVEELAAELQTTRTEQDWRSMSVRHSVLSREGRLLGWFRLVEGDGQSYKLEPLDGTPPFRRLGDASVNAA